MTEEAVTCGSEIECPVVSGSATGKAAVAAGMGADWEDGGRDVGPYQAPSGAEACTWRDQDCPRARAEGVRRVRIRNTPQCRSRAKDGWRGHPLGLLVDGGRTSCER